MDGVLYKNRWMSCSARHSIVPCRKGRSRDETSRSHPRATLYVAVRDECTNTANCVESSSDEVMHVTHNAAALSHRGRRKRDSHNPINRFTFFSVRKSSDQRESLTRRLKMIGIYYASTYPPTTQAKKMTTHCPHSLLCPLNTNLQATRQHRPRCSRT